MASMRILLVSDLHYTLPQLDWVVRAAPRFDLVVLAGFAAIAVAGQFDLGPLAAFACLLPLAAASGYALQRYVLNDTLGKDPLPSLVVTFGLSIVIQNVLQEIFSADPRSLSAGEIATASARLVEGVTVGVLPLATFFAALLVAAPELLAPVPGTALAAVVIAAAIGLIEVTDLRRIYRIQRWEFWLSVVCFVGVAVLGVIPGIGLAIVIAVIEFLWDGWRPHYAVLGRVDGIRGYHDITRYPDARLIPGLVLFRWDAPLFFANAELFHRCVLEAVARSPTPVRRIIVAAEPVTSIDVTSADMLAELEQTLRASRIELRFAEMKDPVKDKLKRFELLERFGDASFYPTVGAAVDAYIEEHAVDWQP